MAELLKKFKCKTTTGEIQELSVYTTLVEATNEGEARQVKVEVEPGNFMTGYIGLTKDFDTPKASGINFKNAEEHWKMRKYMGRKSFFYYMKNTYPDTYQSMTELPEEMPDTSDGTDFSYAFYGSTNLEILPELDTRNGTAFNSAFRSCSKIPEFKKINTSKGINLNAMYASTGAKIYPQIDTSNNEDFSLMYFSTPAEEYPQLDTSKGRKFNRMYEQCSKATKVSDIDLLALSLEKINTTALGTMLLGCSSLLSITFNNVPQGVTEEQLRTAISAPETCQIIINYRGGN